jgi:hypothetical protein
MEITLTGMPPIPVEYIIGFAQTKATDAQRRPYVSLVERWGEEQNMAHEASKLLKQLREKQEIDIVKMPREFTPRYRQIDVAKQLIGIIRRINEIISTKQEKWTWAHVMRVMVDEGILFEITTNRFDSIICSMIPDKGLGTVRKHGDYRLLMDQETPWSLWPKSHLDPVMGSHRTMCNMIAQEFAPVLTSKIMAEY